MTNAADPQNPSPIVYTRWTFLRDAALFQGKLLIDGFRDVLLMPAAFFAAVIDVITRADPPGYRFYEVVHFGRQTEDWIGLFEAAERAPKSVQPRRGIDLPSIDDFVVEVEQKIRAEHQKGDISASAKQAFDRVLEAARNAAARATESR